MLPLSAPPLATGWVRLGNERAVTPALTMDDLERVGPPAMLLPPGVEVRPARLPEYAFRRPVFRGSSAY